MPPVYRDPRLPERFWSKVRVNEESGCWEWIACLSTSGYGRFGVTDAGTQYAHRVAYEALVGGVASGLHLDHICHVTECVNPSHLQPATRQLNQQNRKSANSNSRSGVRGVTWVSHANAYRVSVYQDRRYDGGYFKRLPDAERAAVKLRNLVHTNNLADRQEVL